MSTSENERFGEDLEPVASWLRAQRPDPDPLKLDQIKRRAMTRASHRERGIPFVKSRIATIITIVGLAGGTGGALAVAAHNGSNSSKSSAASGQYKPGWGCGDKNHTHTGPPGNPNATSPCK